jgi:hypothetical protein
MRCLFALFAMLAIAACSPDVSETSAVEDTNVAQVGAYKDGRITLNGRAVSIEEIREAFAELSRNNGAVWYYREAADSEPHPNAMLVVEAIVNARLPVSMSTKSDFSDVVLPDGTVRRR